MIGREHDKSYLGCAGVDFPECLTLANNRSWPKIDAPLNEIKCCDIIFHQEVHSFQISFGRAVHFSNQNVFSNKTCFFVICHQCIVLFPLCPQYHFPFILFIFLILQHSCLWHCLNINHIQSGSILVSCM